MKLCLKEDNSYYITRIEQVIEIGYKQRDE